MAAFHSPPPSDELPPALAQLSKDTGDLWAGRAVERLANPPDPLTFHREYVARSTPVVIRGGMRHWRAMQVWSAGYLAQRHGEVEVTVNVTPDGRGDAVKAVPADEVAR